MNETDEAPGSILLRKAVAELDKAAAIIDAITPNAQHVEINAAREKVKLHQDLAEEYGRLADITARLALSQIRPSLPA